MVQKKGEKKKSIVDIIREIDERHPVIDTKWSVEEVTPGYNTGGYYDQDIPEGFERVSDYFETREEAEAWMDEHEADEGKFLAVRKHALRVYTTHNWVSVRVKR